MNPDYQQAESQKYTRTARVMPLDSGRWAVFDQAWKGLRVFDAFGDAEAHVREIADRALVAPPKTLKEAVKRIDNADALLAEIGL